MNWTKFGIIGSVITGLCCFTPVLVVLLGVIGLSWLIGYLDYVLLPAFVFFVGLSIYSTWRTKTHKLKVSHTSVVSDPQSKTK
jgi:mercuric ion transport protein